MEMDGFLEGKMILDQEFNVVTFVHFQYRPRKLAIHENTIPLIPIWSDRPYLNAIILSDYSGVSRRDETIRSGSRKRLAYHSPREGKYHSCESGCKGRRR
jgi:hypothetical protein